MLANQAAQIARLQLLAKRAFPETEPRIMWIMMTSSSTRVPLECHLRDDVLPATPGLHWDQIRFFEQGVMPCFDNNGRFLLASKCSLATAPG